MKSGVAETETLEFVKCPGERLGKCPGKSLSNFLGQRSGKSCRKC